MKKSTIIKTLGIITAFSIAIPSAGILAKNALQSSASEYSITQTEEASELSNSISDNNAIYASGNSADTANNSLGDSADVIPGDLPENNPSDGMPGNPPDGNTPDGMPGNPPDGNPPDGVPGNPPEGNPPDKMPGGKGGQPGPGGSSSSVTYDASEIITSDTTETGKSISSDTADVSALIVSGSTVTEDSINISKTGSSEGGDNCNFYGQNAAVLAKDGAVLYISNADIYSNASGANGVFSYGGNEGKNGASGDGTTVYISDSTITTEGNGSGGIMTTGGGTTYATNLTITTSGQSSAAIRTDRGGGTVTVDGGTYTTNGLGSPAVYSTADITVKNANLISNLSEGVVIEGKNTVTLENVNLTANNTKTNGNATHYDTIFLYQSMSGDADSGTSVFTMNGGTLTSLNGEVFHVTNTNAVINLKCVEIINKDSDNTLLTVTNDGWSGADNIATLNADSQKLTGSIIVSNSAVKDDNNSKLTLNLTNNSVFEGSINTTESDKGTVDVSIDESSAWKLTADSYVSSISGTGTIDYNGYTLYVGDTAYTSENPLSGFKSGTVTASTSSEITFKNVTKTFKAATLETTKKSYSVIKDSNGETVSAVKYYGSSSDYITVSSKGKVTVKKGTPAGTYKVRIKVTSSDGSVTKKTIKIKVK